MSESTDIRLALTDLAYDEIAVQLALKPFQGKQIFHWIHKKREFDVDAMTNLSKDLRQTLKKRCVVSQLDIVRDSCSSNTGTRKLLFRLRDGETVEAVSIPDRGRRTFCLSTQVGCAVKCTFCATGLSGYTRNLSPGEIAEQALHLMKQEGIEEQTPNIVFMGMGEPFRNYDGVIKSIHLLRSKEGLGIGARKITVSTVGDVPGIERFAKEDWQVRLSISLHAANDALRSKLVPTNRKHPVKSLIAAVSDYVAETGRQVTFEWTLLNGVNDSSNDVDELAKLIGHLKATVNLIPYNAVAGLDYAPPPRKQCEAFRDGLTGRGIKATLRRERGQDINAACGQLRRQSIEL